MSGAFLARVHDRPGALERLVGLLRRRAFAVRRLSVGLGDDGALEVLLRVDDANATGDRVRAELLALHDVIDVRDLADPHTPAVTRELLLAWIRPDAAPAATGSARVVAVAGGQCLLELTGSPDEIDAVIARMGSHGMLSSSVRSGEVAAPVRTATNPERSDA
jgi:acetolactate synthase small subunit